MTITVKSREEMIEVVYNLVRKGLTFKVNQMDEDYYIELTGGY